MIRANELMIGNYVSRPDLGNGEQRTEQVLAIYERVKTTGPIKTIVDFSDIKPIPLTEEWLIKFGFVGWKTQKYKELNYTLQTGLCQFIKKNGYMYIKQNNNEIGLNDIDTVHRLQNLYFALTGEQLTIK